MIGQIMGYISRTRLFGVIPLDLTMHFLIGGILTIVGLKFNLRLIWVFLGLVLIAGLKEANDYFLHQRVADWTEYASDFGITFVYIAIIYFVRKIKKSSEGKGKFESFKGFD